MQLNSRLNIDKKVRVEFDEQRGKFHIFCPPWRNDDIRTLPNRRWNKARECWVAPAIRLNVEALREIPAEVSEAAEKAMCAVMERAESRSSTGFPSMYKFKRPPRPKQLEALNKIYGVEAAGLFMDMRTGKTKVVIDAVCAMRIDQQVGAVILICPLSLRRNWLREIERDATIDIDTFLLDTKKQKAFDRWMLQESDLKWLLVGVESLAAGRAFDMVQRFARANSNVMTVVDESSKIKSHSANRSKAAVAIGRNSKYRYVMTGTPMTRSPLDLFMQFEFLDPNILGIGDFWSFQKRYAVMAGHENKQIVGFTNIEELVEIVSPFVFQVRQSEVIDCEKVRVVREVTMGKDQSQLYKTLHRTGKIKYDSKADPELIVRHVLEKMLRLQEITGGHVSKEYTPEEALAWMEANNKNKAPKTYRVPVAARNPKVLEVLECAEEYEGSMIVWCAFRDEIAAVTEALRSKYGHDQVVNIHGDIGEDERDLNINVLFKNKQARFCVGNAATGGMGLTMDVADTIVYFSSTFNYGDREQSEERATADGKSVLIVDLVCPGSIDELIQSANADKKEMSEYIRSRITELEAIMAGIAG